MSNVGLSTRDGKCYSSNNHVCIVKVSFEAPPGVKRNLQRTLEAWGPTPFLRAPPLQAHLLFMLAWLHAILQERRSYMPQVSYPHTDV